MAAVQFYAPDKKNGGRRIYSFKVDTVSQALRFLSKYNIQAGWFVDKKLNINHYLQNKSYKHETNFEKFLNDFFSLD